MLPRKFLIGITLGFLVLSIKSLIVKADTHSCYHCDGEDCEDPVIVECSSVKQNDECFIRFEDITNDVVQMGCIYNFIEQEKMFELIKNKSLYVCNGENCNDFAKLANPNQCTQCSSNNEETCATKPHTITKQQSCNMIPYTQCYQRINGEATERGCFSDLEGDAFLKCLFGNDDKCKICEGKGCNEEIFPGDRKRCHRCSSEFNVDCQISPTSLSACPTYNATDACVAIYENHITKRGCQSEFECDSRTKNCQICSNDGCNTANIKKRVDGLYGIFQDLPLNCNTCKGDDCEPGNFLNPKKCEGDVYQDCLTVFNASGRVIHRGCENLVLAEQQSHCDSNPELCFRCKANGCNDIIDSSIYQECLSCDAATNGDCLFKPSTITTTRKCTLGCVSSLYTSKSKPKVRYFARTCFEDIEPDNRDSCTVKNDCVKCTGNKCNTDILPAEGRLSCLHCEGANCDAPVSKQCVGYNQNDMCYMYFDNVTLSAVRMGCRSDIADDQLKAEIKQYYICDGDDCNDFKNLPEALFCAACNSENDINCAVDPSKITTQDRCGINPNTQCFARIRDDGHTERGCVSKLPTDIFISCHDGHPNSKCEICTEHNCNNKIFPLNRNICHRCNSLTDTNCEANSNVKQPCPLYQIQDNCVTQFIDGVTRRDCESEITCKGLGSKNCRKCSYDACNDINLADLDIGDVGLFTNLPLNCHQCNSTEECKLSSNTISLCTGNIHQTCTTVFNNVGDVVNRGCSDSFEEACSAKENKCFNCKSNVCNLAQNEKDYVDCISCDTVHDDDCVFNVDAIRRTRKCHKSCMTALYPRTNDEDGVYELIRTCLDDKDLDDQNACVSSQDPKCSFCSGDKCNTGDLGKRKTCYQCKGDECQIPKVQTCRSVTDNDQCFLQWDEAGLLIELGCKSKYNPAEVDILVKQKYLWLCNDDNCNHIENGPKAHMCALCNSRTDPNCAVKPNEVTSWTNCAKLPNTQCYSRVLDNGHTERGCLSSLDGEIFVECLYNKNSTKCLSCEGDKCNQESHPSERLSCHVCSSTSSATCESNPDEAQFCLLYSPDDKCVSSVDIKGNTIRGCSSHVSCNASNITICQKCEGDSCNVANLKRKIDGKPGQWQSLPLTCLNCKNLEDCKTGSSSQICSNSEYCMTVFDINDEVIKRGCSDSVEEDHGTYCNLNSSNCFNCNSNLCNKASSLSNYIECVYCDSETNSDCAISPLAIENRRKCNGDCMTALYSAANSSVYEVVRTCLDDKETADQINCANGNSLECQSCSGSTCNTIQLPESRLSCYNCQGESCEDAQQSLCLKYKSDDKCFILFNNVSDIVQMGCISDLEENFVSSNLHILYICGTGDNCNGYENLPSPTLCTSCNSNDDEDCALNPGNIPTVATCSALPNTQCYTTVNIDGSTERGCISRLTETQIIGCLSGINADCNICASDRCNTEIFPADRRSCHRCNTKDDPKCERSPDSASVCPVYTMDQFCATKLVNSHTYRGCSTEFQCDDSDKQYCRLCHNSDNCNVVDLASANIGYPGNWQGVPINCYTCKNEECQDKKQTLIQACRNNNRQNCVTVFALNGSVVERGCSDLIYAGDSSAYCDKNPQFCKFCKSNGCNMANNLTTFVDCLFCEGVDNSKCITYPGDIKRTRSCYKNCMTAMYPRSDEENPAYELARGCLDDLDMDDRDDCKNGTKPYCQVCNSSSCNTAKIPEDRLKCNVCSGADCEEPRSVECTAFRKNDQCFTLFSNENDVQRMGCASDLEHSDLVKYNRQMLLCDGDTCNSFESFPSPISCRSCNSVDNSECASKPIISTATVCHSLPHLKCYTRIDENGATHRGCLSDVDNNIFDDCSSGNSTTCGVCTTDNCNVEIYPLGRRSCIQCDSDIYSSCEDNANEFASICSLYYTNDSCITKLEGLRTIRGCASEMTCDTGIHDTCRICNKSDNCNTVNLLSSYIGEPGKWQGLPLNCYQCEGDECSSGNGRINKCEGNNLQTCMTVFNAEGNVVKRGCSDAVISTESDYCDENTDKCFSCKSNGCNIAKSLDDYVDCYFCDSSDSKSCAIKFNGSKTKTRKCHNSCMVALYARTSASDPSYELSRSCLDDLDLDDRNKCINNDNELCKACNGSLCNNITVPEEPFECFTCVDDDCEDMQLQQCSSYHPKDQCYVLFNNESSIVAMGCRSEFEQDAVKELVKQKQLLLCNGRSCNAPGSLPTPKFCSVCSSAENPLCATNPNLVGNIQRCASVPYIDCYSRINSDGHTERGCLGSLEEDTFYDCLINTDGLCETCVGDKCNEIDVFPANRQKCHQCNSVLDPNCASTPNSNIFCAIYQENDNCVTNFRNGVTTRGCGSSMKCDNKNDPRTCRICETNGCNTINLEKITEDGIPGRWQDIPITCYTCKGEEECKSKGYFRVCVKNKIQNCMTVFNKTGNVIQKGCSDPVEADNQLYCEKNSEKCLRCNSNGCNEAMSLKDYVECVSCDYDTNGNCILNNGEITKSRQCYKYCMTALYPRFKEENPSYGLSRSCYDDMDLDDRELCTAGSKEHCQVCNTPKCNIIKMPQKRHNCYICEKDDCQIPNTKECPTYRPDDKCYTRYDEKNAIIAFGCRSEFSNADADYFLKEKRLHLCDGENCNSFDNIPNTQTCALCNSRTDKNCAVNPGAITTQTTCTLLPFTDCYLRVLDDGATERGCLSNLYDDEFLGCMNGTSKNCKTCKGNNCNSDIFPETRLRCHVCDSILDPNCQDSPNSLGICLKYDPEDTCVTALRDGVTYRGCSSSLVCDATNAKTCVKCSKEGCNTINLAQKQDDNFGKWQDLPLTCLSCSGSDCDSSLTTVSLTCQLNNEQDCMTVFDVNGKVIRRGCADIVVSEHCSENDENCYSCKSNDCNTAISKSDFVECIYCNSHKNQDCLWNPLSSAHNSRLCQGHCMTALFPSDSSEKPAYAMIRTCLNDKEVSDQNTCSNNKDAKCSACRSNKCNTDVVPVTRLSCFTCEKESCEEPVSKICALYKEDDQCFIQFDDTNSVSEMGCLSSFHNQALESIIKTKRVYVCSGTNCNVLDEISNAQTCAVCDSREDVSCAVSPIEIGTFSPCSMLPYTSCYSKLTSNGTTERGCLTDLPADVFAACVLHTDKNCGICNKDGCNREIFPPDRQQCFTCTSKEESSCESYPTNKMACPIVSETESCVSALSGNVTVRGCKSFIYCDTNDSATCRSCFGSECNSIDLFNKHDDGYHGFWQILPLKCHTCEGEHCLHSLGQAVTCSSRNINQDCMTVFDDSGQVERRGCSDDVEDYKDLYCRQHPENCIRCKSNECNIAWSLEEFTECSFCNSVNEPLCVLNPEETGFKSRKCYNNCMVAMKDQQIIRSCLDDKEMWEQSQCQNSSSKECGACSGKNCNTFAFPYDRLKCHVCVGLSCSTSISQYCKLYENNDFCFAKYDNGLVNVIGCASSQNASDIAEWTAQNKLYKCESGNCNELSRLPTDGVCVACNSNENTNCAQNPLEVTTTETCQAPNEKCFTQIDYQGHTIRGCFNSLNVSEVSCEALGTCSICTGEKCNNKIYPANRLFCYMCDSVANKDCASSPSNLMACPIHVNDDKCVSAINDDGLLSRGCASQLQCENNDSNYCNICNTNGCNTVELKGSGLRETSSLFLTLLLAFVSAFIFKY